MRVNGYSRLKWKPAQIISLTQSIFTTEMNATHTASVFISNRLQRMPHTEFYDRGECHTSNFSLHQLQVCNWWKRYLGKSVWHTHTHRGREETKAQHIDVNVNLMSAWRWKCWCRCGNSKTCRCNTPGNCRPERCCQQMLIPEDGNCLRHCHSYLEQNYVQFFEKLCAKNRRERKLPETLSLFIKTTLCQFSKICAKDRVLLMHKEWCLSEIKSMLNMK